MMKKFFVLFIALFISLCSLITFWFAQSNIDWFIIETNPETFDANETVDLTITAVKDWEVYTDYMGTVVMWIVELTSDEYSMPAQSIYTFTAEDLWSKTFSKWLSIYQDGTYTLKVEDIAWDSIEEITIVIWDPSITDEAIEINIVSPSQATTESDPSIDVVGNAPELPNANIDLYLNNQLVWSTRTNGLWDFNATIMEETIIKSWDNIIVAKSFDLNGNLIWESSEIPFVYSPASDDVIESFEVLPSNIIDQWEKFTVNLLVDDSVTSAILNLSNGKQYPMDFVENGSFTKEFTPEFTWSANISVVLFRQSLMNNFDDLETLNVNPVHNVSEVITGDVQTGSVDVMTWDVDVLTGITIQNLKVESDSVDGSVINLSWEDVSPSGKYKLAYGNDRNTLSNSIDLDTNQVMIENLDPETFYYFQVGALDENSHEIWEKSNIVEYKFSPEVSCIVENIKVEQKEEDWRYFLDRDEVEWALKYEIYKAEFKQDNIVMSDMNKVYETTETEYEYPFNPNAESEEFAYYAVSAICSNGQTLQIDDVKEVQVWPMDNLILVIVLALLWFSVFKIYREIEN